MAGEAFNLPTEEEERAELAALAGALEQPVSSDAQLDAVASDALRIMAREQAEIDRYKESMQAEISRIQLRIGHYIEKHAARYTEAERVAQECAKRATFPGKSKSRKVGFGSYGKRQKAEKVELVDEAAFITWLRVAQPNVIRQVTTEKIYAQDYKPVVIDHIRETGEVPPGTEHIEAHDEFYGKPEGVTE